MKQVRVWREKRQKKVAIKNAIKSQLDQAKTKLQQMTPQGKHKNRHVLRAILLAIVILIIFLFLLRDCEKTALQGKIDSRPIQETAETSAKLQPPQKPRLGRIAKQSRNNYKIAPQKSLPWMDEFRLQVAARSARLAKCFVGVERPGSLDWSCTVNPKSGVIFEQEIEMTQVGATLSQDQENCISSVLADPGYHFNESVNPSETHNLSHRLRMVIEF